MPLPLIVGGIAAIAGAVGVGTGIRGGVKLKEANDTMRLAQSKQQASVSRFKEKNVEVTAIMDTLGNKELEILKSFDEFSNIIERIQGRPEFKAHSKEGVDLPEYEAEELKKISAGAGVLLGGLSGAAAGTAGGFAAAGATTSAVIALGTASTGTAISTLSGVAATNATLAALGGGSLATGGGGMALGTAVLGGATLGIGLLVGGIIFNATGSKLSDKADEAYYQAIRTEEEVDKIVTYLEELSKAASGFEDSLIKVEEQYRKRLKSLDYVVCISKKTRWKDFTKKEKKMVENTSLLVGLLYKMCQVQLVLKSEQEDGMNQVNKVGIDNMIDKADNVIEMIKNAAQEG